MELFCVALLWLLLESQLFLAGVVLLIVIALLIRWFWWIVGLVTTWMLLCYLSDRLSEREERNRLVRAPSFGGPPFPG
jgi:uncharacterized membrane protein